METQLSDKKRCRIPWAMQVTGWVIGGIVLATIFAFIFGYFVMLLWNWIMPELFGLPEIDYWLAFGIIILARLIFGGFGGHSHHKKSVDNHHERYYEAKYRRKFDRKFEKFNKWAHYEDYWNEEGREAFEKYVDRKKNGIAGADTEQGKPRYERETPE
ncbi:MAG: hypothetical protein JXA03_07605 [Bacteroidales bacterium]|nr:hypothetical protein [Bacteroidales bacterium]